MQRGGDSLTSCLGPQLAGEKIAVNHRTVTVVKQLGEGGFSFVYLVKDISESNTTPQDGNTPKTAPGVNRNVVAVGSTVDYVGELGERGRGKDYSHLVLKITSIHSRQQRDIAEKEAKLLNKLNHPSIVRIMDSSYRSIPVGVNESGSKLHHIKLTNIVGSASGGSSSLGHGSGIGGNNTHSPQHLILMEYCEGGTALSVCKSFKTNNKRFDLPSLIIAFGQICNAVSYLHAQRPPIVHRDLKPLNFLVKNGAYKLCDFGSAVFGNVDLKTPRARAEAEEVIQKMTTQMFRSPEMVDLYMSKKLTPSTDVWALGCCLYSLAFLRDCFEEGSNLAILSKNYKIPEENPYGEGLVELIDRMLTINCKDRADMTEVILCLSAIYSGRPLPPRKITTRSKTSESIRGVQKSKERVGTFRTDGQGIRKTEIEDKKPVEAKKLNPKSVAARRRKAAQNTSIESPSPIAPLTNYANHKLNGSSCHFFKNFQFETQNSSSVADTAFSGPDDPFQIGEADKKVYSNSNSVSTELKAKSSRDINEFCDIFGLSDRHINETQACMDVTKFPNDRKSRLEHQFEANTNSLYSSQTKKQGKIQEVKGEQKQKKKKSGAFGRFFTWSSDPSEAEI